jgi:hypothetical protein
MRSWPLARGQQSTTCTVTVHVATCTWRKSFFFVDTIIIAWIIRHPTRNRNDPIARAELYQLSYFPRAKWSMHEGVRCFFYSFTWRSWAILDLNQRPHLWSKSSHLRSNQIGRESIDSFSGAIHPSRMQHTTLRCTALSKCAWISYIYFPIISNQLYREYILTVRFYTNTIFCWFWRKIFGI